MDIPVDKRQTLRKVRGRVQDVEHSEVCEVWGSLGDWGIGGFVAGASGGGGPAGLGALGGSVAGCGSSIIDNWHTDHSRF